MVTEIRPHIQGRRRNPGATNNMDHFKTPEAAVKPAGKMHPAARFYALIPRTFSSPRIASSVSSAKPRFSMKPWHGRSAEPVERPQGVACRPFLPFRTSHIAQTGIGEDDAKTLRGRTHFSRTVAANTILAGNLLPQAIPQLRQVRPRQSDEVSSLLSAALSTPPIARRSTRSASPTHRSCIGQLLSGNVPTEAVRGGKCTKIAHFEPPSRETRECIPSPRHPVLSPLRSSVFSSNDSHSGLCLFDYKFSSQTHPSTASAYRSPSAPVRSRNPLLSVDADLPPRHCGRRCFGERNVSSIIF